MIERGEKASEDMTRLASQPRVAVVGCGYWGKNLVRDFAAHGALEAIVEANATTRDAFVRRFGIRAVEFEQALVDPSIDGLVIAAPARLHFELARRGLLAGKHVYVEKPLALSVAHGVELVKIAENAGRVLMVGHLLQYHPAFIALKAFVDAGNIGRIRYAYSNRLSFGILRREEDVLWSFAPHDVSMILALLAEEPDDVQAFAASTLRPNVADFCQVQMRFPGGARSHIFCSWLHPFKEQRLVVVGERGMVVFEDSAKDPAQKLKHYAHTVEWSAGQPELRKAANEAGDRIAYSEGNPLQDECRHFLEAMSDGSQPRTNGAEGLRVLRVLDRASEKLRALS